MSVGVDALDADHKTLVGLVNSLHRSIGDDEEYATLGTVLKALEDYAAHHFAREEKVMEACRYPSLAAHTATHRKLAQQVSELKEHYDKDRSTVRAKDCLDFLHSWLIEHICSTDMDYRSWVIGPTGIAAAEQVSMTPATKGRAAFDWKNLRVLVIDDNSNFCQIVRTILEGVGATDITIVADIAQAKLRLESGKVDVALTDWHVGADNGLELVAWIRQTPGLETLPVLVLSGHEHAAGRDVALASGADDYLEKPVSARGLLLCLARLVQERQG